MTSRIASLSHIQRVRLLYKTCLKLHRGLPTHLQIIGDAYVRDEFKRHKSASAQQAAIFMEAWAKYALTISKQVDAKGLKKGALFGQPLKPDDLDQFNNEQLVQLFELYEETKKPKTDYQS